MNWQCIKRCLRARLWVWLALVAVSGIIAVHQTSLGLKEFAPGQGFYTHYNNFVIFCQSYFHLLADANLYSAFPDEHWDLFKYSPTFAFLMAPFVALPTSVGLFLFTLLNAATLFLALERFPFKDQRSRHAAYVLVFLEATTSLLNLQTNCLIAGLFLIAWLCFENGRNACAMLALAVSVFIKLFGAVALLLLLFYPRRVTSVGYFLLWCGLLFVLPMIAVKPADLFQQYANWITMLTEEHHTSYGLSVMGLLFSWFRLDASKLFVLISGFLLLGSVWLRAGIYNSSPPRITALAVLMVFVTIFNHRAESATFVIAVTGVAIWFFNKKPDALDVLLLVACVVFTVLSPTDLFPRQWRTAVAEPYMLKAAPCIFIWLKMLNDAWRVQPLKSTYASGV